MGACNFEAVDGVSIGMDDVVYTRDEIEAEIWEMAQEGYEDPTAEEAEKRLELAQDDAISGAYDAAGAWSEKLKTWIGTVLPPVFEANDIEDFFYIVLKSGYYSGFQLYVEWDLDFAREQLEQCGVDGIEEVIAQVGNIKRTVEFLLVDYATNNGLGITSGGYVGDVTYEGMADTWKSYEATASDELIKNFKAFIED